MNNIKYRVWNKDKECYFLFDTRIGFSGTFDIWGKIEQYTGLKDKTGTEIYEGDLVKIGEIGEAYIIFEDAMFSTNNDNNQDLCGYLSGWLTDIEIIGNIHEED